MSKAGWVKIKCERCDGTGYVPRNEGHYTINSNRRKRPRCGSCQGDGFNVMKKDNTDEQNT